MKKRQFYLSVTRDDRGKKVINFGGKAWGDLPKDRANARGVRTGDNLMVVDVDTKDLTKIDKKLIKLLPLECTVETAKGFHWYFTGADDVAQTQKLTEGVDIRNKGGFVFDKYWGKDTDISYEKVGSVYTMTNKLHKYLLKLHSSQSVRVGKLIKAIDGDYPEFDDGEQHEMIRVAMQEDFKRGLSFDQVYTKGQNYIKKYLKNNAHEQQLMDGRINWAFKAFEGSGSTLEGEIVKPRIIKKEEVKIPKIKANMSEEAIKIVLRDAKSKGAFEYDNVRKQLKLETKLSMATLDQMVTEEMASNLDEFFNGHVCWDSLRGVFMEVTDKRIKSIGKSNFAQTVMSRSGYMTPTEVAEVLHGAEDVEAIYRPDVKERYIDNGNDRILNTYYGVKFSGDGQEIPPTIKLLLDNLFLTDPAAKSNFINWMAYVVQLRKRSGVAWGFFGAAGTGKGLITDIMCEMLGANNCSMNVGDSILQESYNSYVDGKLFVHLNEVASDHHGRHGVAAKLKALVGDSKLQLRIMRTDPLHIDNYCNVILNSNKPNPIELDKDDRRWNMIITNNALTSCDWWKGDKTYKKAISEALDFGAYLMNFDVDIREATRPMAHSKAKSQVIALTTSTLEQLAQVINSRKGLADFMELDSENIICKEIEWAEKNGKYANSLLLDIYKMVKKDDRASVFDMNRYLKIPFIKANTKTFKNKQGIITRGLVF